MVAKKPEDRPQSMLQVIAELERCLTSGSATISVDSRPNPGSVSSATGLGASPSNSSRTQASLSERDAETIVASSSDSRTSLPNEATVVLDSSVVKSPATGMPAASNKSRKAMLISAATVVVVLLAIVVAMSGKSPKPSDEKLVANSPNLNAQSSESPATNTEVRESAEPNRSPMDTALMFDGDDRVEIPSLTFDPQGSYTLEGFIASPVKADKGAGLAFGMPDQSYLSFTRLNDWRWVYQPQKRSGGVEIAIAGAAARPERTHLACVRDGHTHRLFVGGKLFHKVGEKPSPAAGTSPFLIGSEFRGEIDELRVSRVARYKADFAPPARFESDADTLALYHFDEGQGDQLLDSSGNNHHGKISGAKWVRADGSTIAPALAKAPFDAKQARAHQEAWAKHLGTTVETTNSVGAKMILLPPGEFLMGTGDDQLVAALKDADDKQRGPDVANQIRNAERPRHRVLLTKPFWLGATEVTLGQFRKFVEATKYQTGAEKQPVGDKPKTYLKPGYEVTDESPVSEVNYEDVVAYCRWLSEKEQTTYRLPTEAEWEYACRAGTTTAYSCGDTLLDSHEWSILNSQVKAQAVATKKPNPFGLFDMHGNLSEWCQDRFDERWYEASPSNDPLNNDPGKHFLVIRGGNWDYNVILRSAYRWAITPDNHAYTIGFRVVREIGTAAVAPAKNVANQDQTPIGGRFSLQLDPNGRIDIPLRLPANSSVTYEFELTRKPPDPTNLHHQLATLIRGSDLKQFQDKLTLSYYSSPRFSINALPGRERFFLAATVTETKLRLFINGLQVTEDSPPVPVSMSDLNSVYLGMSPGAPSNFRAYDAPLHRFRLSRGERYSADYDPAGEWLPDEQTLVLYDFRRGGTADQVLDLSANKKHGKLVGAKWIQPGMAAVPSTDVDRAAATWVIAQGGDVMVSGKQGWVATVNDLPDGDLEVRLIRLKQRLSGEEADLVPLRELKHLEFVGIDNTHPTAAGITALARLPKLERVSCGGQPLSDEQMTALARLNNTTKLYLAGAQLKSAQCAFLAKSMPQVGTLNLMNNPLLDDAALAPLGELRNLKTLQLQGTKVTAAGIAKLQQALPNCSIEWDGAATSATAPMTTPDGRIDLLALFDVKRDVLAGEWTREAKGLKVKQSETTVYVPRLQWPYQPPEEYDYEIEFTQGNGNGTVEQLLSAQSRSFAWVLNSALKDGVKAGFETLDGMNLDNRKDASIMRPKLLEPGRRYRSRVEVRKRQLRAFLDDELLVEWSGDFQRLDIIPRNALRDKLHLGLAANDRGALFHKVTVREVSGVGKLTSGVAGSEASSAWTDWLGPRLKHADFFSQFDGRVGWQREGDAITTTQAISGQAVLPDKTRNGSIRLTYLLRDSKGIQINARDRVTNGERDLYVAQDHGTQISITMIRAGMYKVLVKEPIPASIPKDAQRTLEFRIVGDTLTATFNGSVVATVKEATLTEGNFALVALKGVLVQKVEYQLLDEPIAK